MVSLSREILPLGLGHSTASCSRWKREDAVVLVMWCASYVYRHSLHVRTNKRRLSLGCAIQTLVEWPHQHKSSPQTNMLWYLCIVFLTPRIHMLRGRVTRLHELGALQLELSEEDKRRAQGILMLYYWARLRTIGRVIFGRINYNIWILLLDIAMPSSNLYVQMPSTIHLLMNPHTNDERLECLVPIMNLLRKCRGWIQRSSLFFKKRTKCSPERKFGHVKLTKRINQAWRHNVFAPHT